MHATTLRRVLGLVLAGVVVGTAAEAQDSAHAHIMHAADAFADTPGGLGLLPTAMAEAEVAAQHAELAMEDPLNLDAMRRHAGHVLHALDPAMSGGGPGLGYGVMAAASGAARHVGLALLSELTSDNLGLHARHIATSLDNVVRWTEEAVPLARQIQSAPSAASAAPLVARLNTLCRAIVRGMDADRDGRVGWQEGEGGLAQATYHMNLLKRGEGLIR